jgi:hypothetical protein
MSPCNETISIFCYRTTKARSVTLRKVCCTSQNAFVDWHRKAIGRRSGRSTSSMMSFMFLWFCILTNHPPSVTTSTDTIMLRVLLSALEGAFAQCGSDGLTDNILFPRHNSESANQKCIALIYRRCYPPFHHFRTTWIYAHHMHSNLIHAF